MKLGQFATLTPKWGCIQLTRHKFFEYQFESNKFNSDPFELSLTWTSRCDHAGIDFVFSVYKLFWICFSIFDNRHWDFNNECWKQPDACTYGENSWHRPDEPTE